MRRSNSPRLYRTALVAAAMLLAGAYPAAAQTPGGGEQAATMDPQEPGMSLEQTMREFLAGVGGRNVARFFPRHGDWAYHLSQLDAEGRRHAGVHRFAASDAERAIARPDGPLCDQFARGHAIAIPSFVASAEEQRWRQKGTRFETDPSGEDGRTWVTWRRENDRWVINALGVVRNYAPEPADRPRGPRDAMFGRPVTLPFAADTHYAAATAWYPANEPITVDGQRYVKYGLARPLQEAGALLYYASFKGVPVFTGRDEARSGMPPQVLYVPVDSTGLVHPYQGYFGNGCRN